jgi:hypothetical protein
LAGSMVSDWVALGANGVYCLTVYPISRYTHYSCIVNV